MNDRKQFGKPIFATNVDLLHGYLSEIEKSNLKTETKMKIAMLFSFLDAQGYVQFVDIEGDYI